MRSEAAGQQSGAHFQLYSESAGSMVRWRLLSGNNREMGRAATEFRDAEDCRLGIKELLYRLPDLRAVVRRQGTSQWVWSLNLFGVAIAVAAHPYDRQIRAEAARLQFVTHAPNAWISDVVMVLSSRRWGPGPIRGAAPDANATTRPAPAQRSSV